MKKRGLIKLLVGMTLAASGAFVFGSALNSKKAEVAEAAETDYIYLDNSNFYEGNERYAAYFFTDGVGSTWVSFTYDASIGYNKVARQNYEKVIICRMNGGASDNNWDNRWNQTANLDNHTGIYKPYSKSGTNVGGSWRYPLTVGETTSYMIPHGTGEVKATVNASANDAVSLKEDEDSNFGTLYPQQKASNNMTADRHIKISGSATLYVSKSGWSTWVSGYAPSSTKLQDFCDALLALNCDAKDLSSCGWSGLDSSDKTAFNGATVTLGEGVSYSTYGNVVNEAATRYSLLISKGATPLSGVTLASRTSPIIINNESTNTISIIVIISLVSVTAIGGYFFIKRRQEN